MTTRAFSRQAGASTPWSRKPNRNRDAGGWFGRVGIHDHDVSQGIAD